MLNTRLPEDISITECADLPPTFDPQKDAKLKKYRYCVHNAPVRSPFNRKYVWYIKQPLERNKMKNATHFFTGNHDFTSFANPKAILAGKNPHRKITKYTVELLC